MWHNFFPNKYKEFKGNMLLYVGLSIQVNYSSQKLLHKTQSHCCANFILADVLYNNYMHTLHPSLENLYMLRNTR
jgi:hypothetical protein